MSDGVQARQGPSTRRRVLAVVSLVAMVLGLTLLVVFLVRQPILLIGGLIGMALVGAGGWWLATEQNPRRAIGVVIALVGALAIVWSVLRAFSDNYAGLWRLLVVLAVLGLAIAAARGALVRELHEIDELRAGHVKPKHPVLICNPKSGGGKVEKFGLIDIAEQMGVEVVLLEK